MNFVLSFFKYSNSLLNAISKPNPLYFKDNLKYQIAHIRSKALISVQLTLFIIYVLDMLLTRISLTASLLRIVTVVTLCGVMILSCRLHPYIFHVFYLLVGVIYGPSIIQISIEDVHRAWFAVFTLPTFLYVFTGSVWFFMLQLFVQMYYVNTIYAVQMKKAIMYMAPDDFKKALVYSTNTALIFSMLLIILTHYFMQHAYKTLSIIEKKKHEAENQKTFLLGFSHELRNLINSLTGNVKLAGIELLTSKAKELLLNAEVCGELLLHLVNNILDTGKVEIGELEINPVPTPIYDTFERIWGVCSELIRGRKLAGKMKIPRNLPKNIMIDHYRLIQIFLNLVGNAAKFTEKGSIDINVEWIARSQSVEETSFQPYPHNYHDEYDEGLFEKRKTLSSLDMNILTLDTTHKKVKRTTLATDNCEGRGILKIAISDTGCGMSKDETDRLFQKFTQVTSDMSKRKLGTGLGLFITKQLCQRMNGEIRVFSKKGSGTTFIFCIPTQIVPEEYEHLTDIDSMRQFISSKKLKAMIVDDTPFNVVVLKGFFDKLGIEVIDVAANGLEAYQKYSKHADRDNRPDIVTMDLEMPLMDGKQSSHRIRRFEARMNLEPCFLAIISGNCSESEIEECLNQNGQIKADGFIKKPATVEELLQVIAQHFVRLRNQNKTL